MKTKFLTRILALLSAILMLISIIPIQAVAAVSEILATGGSDSGSDDTGDVDSVFPPVIGEGDLVGFPNTFRSVSSAEELEQALSEDIDAICITDNFAIDRTFYVKSDTIVYSESAITLTRSPEFAGDVFVVGQDSEDNLCTEQVTLSVGGFNGDTASALTVNGNSENMTVDVVGTVIFVCPNAKADLYDNLVITNCKKVGNERAHNSIYELSNTSNIGGAVAILSKDAEMNVYGGEYTNNSVNTSGTSIYGGAFYNYATLSVYGGLFEGNSANRAGAFYNYRTIYIYSAQIKNNTSSTAGGAIYLPASTGAKLYLGGNSEIVSSGVLFSGNHAGSNGGAIFASGRVSAQDTVFEENSSVSAGGAIYVGGSYSAINFTDSEFNGNTAGTNGGAIFASGHNTLSIANDVSLLNVGFASNSATSAGAVYLAEGSCAYAKNCEFSENSATSGGGAIYSDGATLEIDRAQFYSNTASAAGAIYLIAESAAIINKMDAQGNTATGNAGAIYSSASDLKLYNSNIKNSVSKAGSAIYLGSGATSEIYGSSFTGNACLESNTSNAATVFIYTGAVKTTIHSCVFTQNTSYGNGGALFISNKSIVDLYNVTAIGNSAGKGGFLYTTTTGTTTTASGITVSGNSASGGGNIIWGNSTGAKLIINKDNYVDLDVEGALPSDYWATAIVNKLSVTESDAQIPAYTDYSGEIVDGMWSATVVKTFEELKAAILAGDPYIKIVNDIEISETLYILSSTQIFSTTPCTLTRAQGFVGSLFVVGKDGEGNILESGVTLTLGLSASATTDLLLIDGKSVESQSAIIVAGASKAVFCENVSILAMSGTDGSMLTVEENATVDINGGKYTGNTSVGNAVILNKGILNVNDGLFSGNSADKGGVIYNVGMLNMLGGSLKENVARLGGAIYNLGELTVDSCDISGNVASENGGAIYAELGSVQIKSEIFGNTAALGGAIYFAGGSASLSEATFTSNGATMGGALYIDNADCDVSIVGAVFNTNTAELGGAIYLANGEFDINDCVFIANSATEGGAIYVTNASLAVNNCTFNSNTATNGGAIYSNGADLTLEGSNATLNKALENGGFVYAAAAKVTMSKNSASKNEADKGASVYVSGAKLFSSDDTFEYGYAFEGGAIYAESSEISIGGSSFTGNDADYNGGAINIVGSSAYINNQTQMVANGAANNGGAINASGSTLVVYDTVFNTNSALLDGGAISVDDNSTAKIFTAVFSGNKAGKNGGAVYASDSGTSLLTQICEFTGNTAQTYGGAVYVCSKAKASVYNVVINGNTASKGGFLCLNGSGTEATVIGTTVSDNTSAKGAFIYGIGSGATLYINKVAHSDTSNSSYTPSYWEAALYGTLTIKTIYDDVPEYIEEGNESAGDLSGAFDVSSAKELEDALLAGKKNIRIVADFEIDRTFYITYDVIIFSTARHTLTRAADFGGDIFVVGERADGSNAMIEKADSRLTLGNPSSDTPSLLIIDGNKDNMTVDVVGTVMFICNGAVANVYNNVTVTNCHKNENERTYNEYYKLSRPNRVGGSVAIIPFGGLNIYGGSFINNSVDIEDASSEEGRNSSIGGVFYNESNLKIYAGHFEGNEGARGGIVYNYGTIKIYGGSFVANRATVSGGVYYSASLATSQLNIGYRSSTPVLFKDNVAEVNGGAICTSTLNGIVIYGNTTFEGNKALTGSGGAIHTSSTFTVMNTVFSGNTAKSRGGAMFVTKSTQAYVTRYVYLENCRFIGNSATDGGAISLYCANSTYESGSIVTTDGCEFISNSAENGGSICVERKSNLTVNNTSFDGSIASGEGGAFYIIGESTVSINNSSIANGTATSHGGAISVRSATLKIDGSVIEGNHSEKNGGAIYVAYSSSIDINARVTLNNSTVTGNSADNGGAIYTTRRAIENDTKVLTLKSTDFANNKAKDNGGAVLLTAGVDVFMKDVTFVSNSVSTKSDGAGGAISVVGSTLEIDGGVFTKNRSEYIGGGIYLGTNAVAKLNNVTASRNSARTNGGFIYSSFGQLTMYSGTVNNNSSNMGAGVYLYEGAVSEIYKTEFVANTTLENGAGAFVYTYGTKTVFNGCSFKENVAGGMGGGMYISGKSDAYVYNTNAELNKADKGGFMYETAAGTVVTLAKLSVSGNTAESGGNIIWGNTTNAVLNIDKAKHTDLDTQGATDDAYWESAIEGLLTVNTQSVKVPSASTYTSTVESVKNTVGDASPSVNDVFDLAVNSSNGYINSTYDKFPVLDNSSNFMSRGTTVFDNINGGRVTVDTFVYPKYSTAHNMTVGEALMIYQAMLYKKANPDEEVHIDIASYRFSVQTAVNINRNSRYFGYTRALANENYDEFGFVRVAYLLVSAAKMGIHVNVLAHRDAYPINSAGKLPSTFETYFDAYVNDYCDPEYAPYGTISDYLTFCYFDWTLSNGGKGGTDMMHTKLCAVSHYLDMNGEVHKNAVWTSSSNLDGIYGAGYNANWKLQTATIISDHEDIYRVSVNYLRLMLNYSHQEGIIEFQNKMNVETTSQIDLILAGKGDDIPENERLVYLGSENDDVFELYFTPFGGDILSWSEIYNPYCKYFRELYNSEDYILFTWNAAEYSGTFPLAQQMEKMLIDAFHKNKNPNNKIYVNMESFDPTTFDDLVEGVDIGYKSINEWSLGAIHNKDLQFSYVKDGQRYYVSLLNSLNLHGGSMYYQSNFALVIKEKTCSENSVFSTVARYTTDTDLVSHTFASESKRQEATETEHGYVYKVCTCCGHKEIINTVHYGGQWIIEKVATPTEHGIRYKKCVICDKVIEAEETKYTGSAIDPETNIGVSFTDTTTIPVSIGKTPHTFEATILFQPKSWSRGGVIMGNYSAADNENALNFEIFTEGRVRLFYITNGIRTDVVFSRDIRSIEPVHIAVTVDGNEARLYVNGEFSESIEVTNPLPEIDRPFALGGDIRTDRMQTFKGKIYSVNLFADVRTAEEIISDVSYVGVSAPDLVYSTYFTVNNSPLYVAGNKVSGQTFKKDTLNEIPALDKAPVTFEATLMLPTSYADRAGVIIGNYTDGSSDTVNIEILAGGKLRLYYITDGVKYSYTFETDVRSDKPINLALTVEDLLATLYINGTVTETAELEATIPAITEGFVIGGDHRVNNEQYFKGTIYSVNLFSSVRYWDEITSDILAVSPSEEGLVYSTYFTESGKQSDYGQSFEDNLIGEVDCTLDKTPVTFEALIHLPKGYADRGGVIFGNNGNNDQPINVEIYTNGKLRLYFINGTTKVDCRFDTDVRSDKPVHIALTVDGKLASLYVNGELAEVRELELELPESTMGYRIGGDGRDGNVQYFKGVIYSVNVFDHVRSEQQIAQDMISTAGEGGLLVSTSYLGTKLVTETDTHTNVVFEMITSPTEDGDGLGRLVCASCGKLINVCSVPFTSDGIIHNDYTSTDGALKDGGYYAIDDSFNKAPLTFEALLKLSPRITDRGGVIFGNYDGTSSGRMNLEIYTNGNPRLWYKVNSKSYSYIFNVDIRSEEPVHLAFTIDGLSASLFVDGELVETITLDAPVPFDGSTFCVANDNRLSAQVFKGEIYSASIFADVRTPEEIAHDIIMITSDSDALLFSKYFVASEVVHSKGPWADKVAVFVGDSITEGVNCEGDTYWELLEKMLELKSAVGMGVAGSCISSSSSYGDEHEPLVNRYGDIPADADLITIFMGTNDYGHDTPLGTIDDTTDTSFYGALNIIASALIENNPNAEIVFITPLHRYGYGTNSATGEAHTFDHIPNGAGHTLEDYVNAIKAICDKYSLNVIDLYTELDMDPSADETREYYMEDGLHPNTAGHRQIAEFLEHALEVIGVEDEQQ